MARGSKISPRAAIRASRLELPDSGLVLNGTPVTSSAAEINAVDGITAAVAELNITDGVTATAAELNKLASVTAGTVSASKAVVVDASSKVDTWDPTVLKKNGTTIGSTAAEIDAVADLSAAGAVVQMKKIAISSNMTGSEQDTAWDLPARCIVINVMIDVTTAEVTQATKTIDVGLLSSESGGDADGFLDGVSVASLGLKQGVHTTGAVTKGALLRETITDSGTDTFSVPLWHLSHAVTARSVSMTSGGAFSEFRGSILIFYIEVA